MPRLMDESEPTDYGKQVQKACAANEEVKAIRTAAFQADVKWNMDGNYLCINIDPEKWVSDWVADPAAELAVLYRQIVLFRTEPKMLGENLALILENKIRIIAEHLVETDE
ncbi:MAG: hypothetical protein KGL39_09870 [Patescibacteria group bacterium]|nr:hypothetical protein [Patescibacteria group bacterium]